MSNETRIEEVLERQKRHLGLDRVLALVVALGLFIAILGLRAASVEHPSRIQQGAAATVAAEFRAQECGPGAATFC